MRPLPADSASAPRYLHVYFGNRSAWYEPVQIERQVHMEEIGEYEGDATWKIRTPQATYYFHRNGSGFASLLDRDGNDWISHHPGNGPEGEYRGIPNIAPAGSTFAFRRFGAGRFAW